MTVAMRAIARQRPRRLSLTLSGYEITDAVRALGVQGDGRVAPDSSMGIWEATTNKLLHSGDPTQAAWTKGGGATSTAIALNFAANPQGAVRAWKATPGTNDLYIAQVTALSGATAGQQWTSSVWARVESGTVSCRVDVEESGGASAAAGTSTTVTLTTAWQRIQVSRTLAQNDRTGVIILLYSPQNTTPIIFWGPQLEPQGLATPYVETGAATATRAAARVQAPASLLNATQGGVIVRLAAGWASTADMYAGGLVYLHAWLDDANNLIALVYDPATDKFRADQLAAGVGASASSAAQAFAAEAEKTVIAQRTATTVQVSVDGVAFVSVANTSIPALAATLFDIGSRDGVTGHVNSRAKWAATFTGTLSDADAATIHGFGNVDPSFYALPGTAMWTADTSSYEGMFS